MKVYFSASITDEPVISQRYASIIEHLKSLRHEVLQYSTLSPQELMQKSDTEIQAAHKRLSQYLRQADIYVAEITKASVGVGYEIAQALADKKPVLVLIHDSEPYKSRATLMGNPSKLIKYTKYNDENLKSILESFVEEARGKIDTKFILIISPEIDKYLEWAAAERRQHKAQIVRNSIEEAMTKDKDYKDFLKNMAT
jgi:2'-deoxynucleoside 5'-phosphate N-hydrolase